MAQPGTTPIGAPIDTYALGNSYATHLASRGKGGLRSVADDTERGLISALRKEEGMMIWHIFDQEFQKLNADLTTWTSLPGLTFDPSLYLDKATYDPTDSGTVVNSQNFGGQLPAYYLARANHTGTQAQSTIVNLVSDLALKENKSEKGVANGYVPLNAGVTIDPIYLGITLSTPLEGWNANTNTPTLADGTGNANEYCFVTVAGTSDLGSGNLVCAIGNFIYHDGTKWNLVATTGFGVSSVTTNLGLQTGAVTLNNTSYLVDSSGKRFVTDNIQAGLNASPNPVTAANPVVTQADLTSLIVVGNGVFMPELFADGQTLGDGTLRLLSSLTSPATGVAYTNVSAGNYWTRVNSAYTINVNTMSIDWIAIQEAFLAMQQDGYSYIISPGGRGYCPSGQLDLPLDQLGVSGFRRGLAFGFNWQFSTMFNRTGTNFIMLNRYFTNQTQISGLNSYLLDYKYKFENFYAKGNGGSGLTDGFIRLGATCHSSFTDIETNSFGCPMNIEFALECMITNIKHVGYGIYGTKVGYGTWTGGTIANAGVNLLKIVDHRCVNQLTPVAGLYLNGGGVINAEQLTFEGGNGSQHHVYFDNPSGGGANYAVSLSDLYFETAGASRAAIRFNSARGDFYVNKWNNVVSPADMAVFVEAMSPPGLGGVRSLYVNLTNNCTDQDPIKLRGVSTYSVVNHQTGYGPFWDVTRVVMPNGSGTFNTATNFDISDPTYILPLDSQYSYTPSPI
jgi:hypothetical protein